MVEEGSAGVRVVDGRLMRLGILGTQLSHIGAVFTDAVNFHQRCRFRYEDRGLYAERGRSVGVGQSRIAAGRNNDTG